MRGKVEVTPPGFGGGRKRGSQNKVTRVLKTAILEAFDQVGGVEYLVRIANEDPRAFCGLLAKVLPTQVDTSDAIQAPVIYLPSNGREVLTAEERAQIAADFLAEGVRHERDGDDGQDGTQH